MGKSSVCSSTTPCVIYGVKETGGHSLLRDFRNMSHFSPSSQMHEFCHWVERTGSYPVPHTVQAHSPIFLILINISSEILFSF